MEERKNSILEQFKMQLENDRNKENYDFPTENENGFGMTDEDVEEYRQALDDLREQIYVEVPKEMLLRVENRSYPKSLIKNERFESGDINFYDENVLSTENEQLGVFGFNGYEMRLVRAKCPICGVEIVSSDSTANSDGRYMHVCSACGNRYLLEKKYPRVAFFKDDKEIKVYFN